MSNPDIPNCLQYVFAFKTIASFYCTNTNYFRKMISMVERAFTNGGRFMDKHIV